MDQDLDQDLDLDLDLEMDHRWGSLIGYPQRFFNWSLFDLLRTVNSASDVDQLSVAGVLDFPEIN